MELGAQMVEVTSYEGGWGRALPWQPWARPPWRWQLTGGGEWRGSGEASEGHQGSSASTHREPGRVGERARALEATRQQRAVAGRP